jgi:hypothetical protein
MSDKMECPGCGAYSSSVLIKVSDDEPCPFCGLSAHAILEISAVRRKKADETLKQQLEKALIERDRAVTEAAKLNRVLYSVRRAIGCEKPYAPHEGMDPET